MKPIKFVVPMLILVVLMGLMSAIPGCTKEQAQNHITQQEQLSSKMGETLISLENSLAELKVLNPDDERIPKIHAAIEKILKDKEEIDAAIARSKLKIESGEDPTGTFITEFGGLLPPPFSAYAAIAGWGATLIAGVIANHRKKQLATKETQLKNVVFAIDTAKREDPAFANAMHNVGGTIRSTMGRDTVHAIDEIRETAKPAA